MRFSEVAGEFWGEALEDDPAEVAILALERYGPEFQMFRIQVGKYTSNEMFPREEVMDVIGQWVNKYGVRATQFITGIVGYA